MSAATTILSSHIPTAAMGDASTTEPESNPSFLLESLKKVSLTTLPKPSIQSPQDVIVRIAQTGICMSDIHYWQRGRIGDFILTSPIVLGHESSGTVTSIGPSVKNLKIGDRVAIEPGVPCRHCNYCRSGAYNLCADTVFAATPPHHGTLSKYYRTSADFCYVLPRHVDDEAGALCEPVAVGVQVCKVGKVGMNQMVVVFGCGTIGLLCQAVARAAGAKMVIGVDVSERRMRLAEELGWADGTFMSPGFEGVPEGMSMEDAEVEWCGRVAGMIKEKFGLGDGPDVVLECTGAQACIQTGVQLMKKGGMYVQAGMGRENVTFPITTACIRDLTIRGSIRYTTGCYSTAVDLVASGKVDPKKLITHRFAFEDSEQAFETVKKGGEHVLKVVISGAKE